jgi:DNA-binding MarR family transcriptional regulator
MTSPTPREVAGQMHLAIGQFSRRIRDTWSTDLSVPERTVLARLDRHGPDTTAGLARWEQITPQSMGKTVNALADRGLVERVADPGDGRRAIVSVTTAGRDLLAAGRDGLKDRIAHALTADFTAEEVALLGRAAPLIDRLSRSI